MAPSGKSRDTGLAIVILRYLGGWTQAELAAVSGVDQGQISLYETGKQKPSRKTLKRLASAAGAGEDFMDRLLTQSRAILRAFEDLGDGEQAGGGEPRPLREQLEGVITRGILEVMEPYLLEMDRRERSVVARCEAWAWADERWLHLAQLPAEEQSLSVDVLLGDERSWALADLLCLEAEISQEPGEALRLARLAARLAEESPDPENRREALSARCGRLLAPAPDGSAAGAP